MTDKRFDGEMNDEECDFIEEKSYAGGEVLEGFPAHIVLHVLMRVAADMGVQAKDKLTKREFVADCVECMDFWYDIWLEEENE